jgi:dihydroneopterin aldolase/2-amino-4-hydroxy-6-hydroxymethyldihydropteridine diphosphokinase
VITVKTDYWLKELFYLLRKTEKKLGRTKSEKWGPREIDLDLLFYDKIIYSDFELRVPHPGILERDFVLVPLCEIDPDFEKIDKNIITKTDYKI